ncbi:hypothetical protein NCLIV_040540 [Neospora caninum Liverpool]|uniref:Heterogeneous nuclear ribonucleoprotein A3 homolog 2 n=1 Tax=Neospora caninum (strain Liverpool) TaxID=572307 RepID=F0VBJ6_NEOCL|nr:hypothetical protein NCLIV_040540 [Neospora caninum Liverpool]CBZ50980.1 hypothetical protein NCLIV_040540 [Neospora caninum Liverpool]CEL68283.1 TPA: Heterogeneous nuclear ribonucleoprotein A3 homolog 2 [Neospora caninum Liverpool]|eukprot:XP_003881013.1 hypothetical protein NCLIV_040540 [Neospora caninum Liverpool]
MAFDGPNNGAVGSMPEDDSGIPLPYVEGEAQPQQNSEMLQMLQQGQPNAGLEQDGPAAGEGANAGDVAPAFGENADSREGPRNEEDSSPPPASDAEDPSGGSGGDGQNSPPRESDKEVQMRKLFVGGLSRSTTTDSLRTYFQQYGDVADSEVLFDKFTGRSRGFGFITFTTPEPVSRVADMRHTVDGTQVEVRRAIPREEAREHGGSGADRDAGRLFVGGISDDVNDESLRAYFRHYGEIQSANVMVDRQNNRPRGFGFVIFRNPDDAEKAIGPHKKLGVHCEAKRAQPRQMNRDRNSGGWGGSGSNWGPGGYGGRGYGGGREGGYGGGRGRDYGNYGPPGGAADPAAGYGMGGPGGVYGGGGYGGYANYNPYYAAYYAQMAAYSAMGGYGGYGGAAGAPGAYGVGSDEGGYGGSPASGGADRGNRMANRSTPY